MHPAIYFLMLLFSIILFPWWMYRRMKRVKELMRQPDDAQSRSAKTEEFVKSEDGLVYGKAHSVDDDLLAADKAGSAMPDIVKTLEGRR